MTKTISAAMQTHLDGEVTSLSTCWAIHRTDGVNLFFTDHDQDIDLTSEALFSGRENFLNANYVASHGSTRTAIELKEAAIGNLEIEAIMLAGGITQQDIQTSKYDGSNLYIFKVNWDDLSDGIIKMPGSGTMGQFTIHPRKGTYEGELRGLGQFLTHRMNELYSPFCRVDLFSNKCKLDESPHLQHGIITTVTDKREFNINFSAASFDDQALTIANHSFEDDTSAPPGNWTEGEVQAAGQFIATATAPTGLLVGTPGIIIADGSPDRDTLTRDGGSWTSDGFKSAHVVSITGSASNDGDHLVNRVTALVLELFSIGGVTDEGTQTDLVVTTVSPPAGANTLEMDQQTPHDLQRTFDIFSDAATISTGGGGEPTTTDIDDGKTILEVTAAMFTAAVLANGEEAIPTIGVIFETGGSVEISRTFCPEVRRNQHGLNPIVFVDIIRTFAIPPTTRQVRIILAGRNDLAGTVVQLAFDNIRATVKPMPVVLLGEDRDSVTLNDWFDSGVVRFITGPNAGRAAEIDRYIDGTRGEMVPLTPVTLVDSNPDTLTRITGSWITDGFKAGQTLTITGSAASDGSYLIDTVVELTITLDAGETLPPEAEQTDLVITAGVLKTVICFLPLPFTPTVGDVLEIYPGCKKRWDVDCVTKFNNGVNFQGEPFVPGQDEAFKSADQRTA